MGSRWTPVSGYIETHAAVHFARLERVGDRVDGVQRLRFDRRFHFAIGGEGKRLLTVFSRSNDRSAHREAIEEDIEAREERTAGA